MNKKHLVVLKNSEVKPVAGSYCSQPLDASPALPDLHRAQLDWDGVDCVLADLDDFAVLVEIQGRNAAGEAVIQQDLLEARDQFAAGSFVALQLIYRFADQTWCDTLMRENSGARLLRMLEPCSGYLAGPPRNC